MTAPAPLTSREATELRRLAEWLHTAPLPPGLPAADHDQLRRLGWLAERAARTAAQPPPEQRRLHGYLTTGEVATRARVTAAAVRREIWLGRLPAIKDGRFWWITPAASGRFATQVRASNAA